MKKCSSHQLNQLKKHIEWTEVSPWCDHPNFTSTSSLGKYTAWRTNHRSSVDVGFLKSFCALIHWWYWYQGSAGANNHFIILMQNKFATNHMPSWWYRMMDKYLPVSFIIDNTMNPKPNLQLYLQKCSPNFQGNSIMLHCWLQTLIIEPSNLPSAEDKYFKFSQEQLLPFSACHFLCFST